MRYTGRKHDNLDDVTRWELESREWKRRLEEVEEEKKTKGKEGRDRRDLAIYRKLEPIRRAYWSAKSKEEQQQILALVLQSVTSQTELTKKW